MTFVFPENDHLSVMKARILFPLMALILVTAVGIGTYVAAGRSSTQSRVSVVAINHIVILLRENHTYDNLFGRFPGGAGTTVGRSVTGKLVQLDRTPQLILRNPGHTGQSTDIALADGRLRLHLNRAVHRGPVQASSPLVLRSPGYQHRARPQP